ncbi:AAA family ATPase [Pseudonocardia endophytica]|uniref:Putative kinase n=1 Tax=Pseudonocardia endophytica TaxID=401976 RepID=A0A4R1HWM6_PSEEN|nr:AAA family ATPase [Pseudonocardia endophytica]TCK25465.1 putative kinase [Pseudonocardia endophytica]
MTLADTAPVRLHVPARSLVLVAGLPGAGKSTLLGTLAPDPTVVVLDSDAARGRLSARLPERTPYGLYRWLVHLLHRCDAVRVALTGPDTVVVHLPATGHRIRSGVLALARLSGREAHLLWVHAEPSEALDGQHVRGRVVRDAAFSGHAAKAGLVVDALRTGPPPGWVSARVVDRACARRGLALDK